jgi:hypothetical protein
MRFFRTITRRHPVGCFAATPLGGVNPSGGCGVEAQPGAQGDAGRSGSIVRVPRVLGSPSNFRGPLRMEAAEMGGHQALF